MSLITQLSPHLFWDTEITKIDTEIHKSFIIKKVLEYGLLKDWILIQKHYGLDVITEQVQTFRDLESKALNFIVTISGVPKEQFRCYTTKLLTPKHWNF